MPNPEATPPRPTTFYDGDHWIRYSDHLAALAEQKKALVGPEITAAGTSSETSALRAEIEEWRAVSAVWERRKDILGAFIQEIAATMPPPASELMLAELHKRISGESAEEKGRATSRAASAIPQRGGEIVSGSAREWWLYFGLYFTSEDEALRACEQDGSSPLAIIAALRALRERVGPAKAGSCASAPVSPSLPTEGQG